MKLHLPVFRRRAGFTVVEVMMASLILMVGFIGLIEAVIITSTTMDHARRQMLANQIINHEIEEMYLSSWSTISNLTTTATTISIDAQFDAARLALGDNKTSTAPVRFTLTRNVIDTDPVTNIREINFVVTWVVTSSRLTSGSTRLTTTHTCANSAWYGKNGLQLSYRKS